MPLQITLDILSNFIIAFLTLCLIAYYAHSRRKTQIKVPAAVPTKPRFRKREKVMFYGKALLRKVRTFTKNTIHTVGVTRTRSKRRHDVVLKLAKKLLRIRRDQVPRLLTREPPPSALEADWSELDPGELLLPQEVLFMLRSVRVLGHFEQPIFLELCKFMESRFVMAGEAVFKVGETDDSIYVVQNGRVNVCIMEPDGTNHCVKEVVRGDSIHSLLSILDVLTGHPAPYKTVSAVAVEDSAILRLPAHAFHTVLDRFPESLVRVVQIIMVRLQRVTFMALHNYLGLSHELMNPATQSDPSLSVHSITISPQGSPMRVTRSLGSSQVQPTTSSLMTSSVDEKVTKVTNYEDDCGSDLTSLNLNGENRRKSLPISIKRGSDATVKRIEAGLMRQSSDFETACAQARVGVGLITDDDMIACGTSPSRTLISSDLQSTSTSTVTKRSSRKIAISDSVTLIGQDGMCRQYLDHDQLLSVAAEDLVKIFGLEDPSLLDNRMQLNHISTGTILCKQGDPDASLIFVVTGMLQVLQQDIVSNKEERSLFVCRPGEIVGSLAVLTGEPSFFTIRARCDSRVVLISKNDFYCIMRLQPKIVLNIGHTVVRRMSGFVRQIDFALDWKQIDAGRALFRQGERADCLHIILNGRMRSVLSRDDGKKELVGEYGRGEMVGVVEVLTRSERLSTTLAVRDTELAQIPDELMHVIKLKHPHVVTRLIHLIGKRMLGSLKSRTSIAPVVSDISQRKVVANLATVAVIPVSDDVPLSNFTLELQHALNAIGPTLRLTIDIIKNRLGSSALDSMNEYRLSSWLGQQEDIHRIVLYQCDYRMNPWTSRCIRQADCIFIVGLAENEPTVGPIENQMEHAAVRAHKELILLHREGGPHPSGTAAWLNARGWCSFHHHIRAPKRMFSHKSPQKLMDVYRKVFKQAPDRMSDFSRLARFLTGTAVGLVLGGGGARGFAHIGMIKGLYEAGIPVDVVGGTSMGAFIGGLWAEERNVTSFIQRARKWAMGMSKIRGKILDLTYPVTAMFKGGDLNKSLEDVFGQRQIEDLWIPYFCVTTDISASKIRVHTYGSMWRYIRASMSLSGYMPPLCDPVDGHLLLDGGYVNNVPADVMKEFGTQTIFAVDVGSQDDDNLTNYGDELSGWWLLWKKWNPWAKPVRVPNMAEIQSRLAYVTCNNQLELVKRSEFCEYIRPPIDKYGTMQFHSVDEISDVGLQHFKKLTAEWEKNKHIEKIFKEKPKDNENPPLHKSKVPVEATFTDLAELISRIEPRNRWDDPRFYLLSDNEIDEVDFEEDDDDDRMSVSSEPIILSPPQIPGRPRAVSDGGSTHSPHLIIEDADDEEED